MKTRLRLLRQRKAHAQAASDEQQMLLTLAEEEAAVAALEEGTNKLNIQRAQVAIPAAPTTSKPSSGAIPDFRTCKKAAPQLVFPGASQTGRERNLGKTVVSALESEVTESAEFDAVSDEIHRWSSLSEGEYQRFVGVEDGELNEFEMMCQLRILFPCILLFSSRLRVTLTPDS